MALATKSQQLAFQAANPDVPFNPATAIAKSWLAQKAAIAAAGTPFAAGVPLAGEQTEADGSTSQAFSSGFVAVWAPGGGDTVTWQ